MDNKNNCGEDCANCAIDCDSRKDSLIERPHELSSIKNVVGVVSGKGGVGKSLVTSMLAIALNRKGLNTAILDADITGPSIPKIFGITEKPISIDGRMYPVESKTGIDIMSINLLLEDEKAPVIWRGPIVSGVVKQFWQEVVWEDIDYMFVDMPPGTGDVPLTIFQSIPLTGIIVVTSPQELVSMVVNKAITMAEMMHVPIIGIIENYSYFECPDCGKEYEIFGRSHLDKIAKENNLTILGKIPIQPELAKLCDKGLLEEFKGDWLDKAAEQISNTQ